MVSGKSPSLLVLSFSEIESDARVLKQVRLFAERGFDVYTCGFGDAPPEATRHFRLSPQVPRKLVLVQAALYRLHLYRSAYWVNPYVRAARKVLRELKVERVIANDLDTAALALAIAPAQRVHLDLHEYWPGRDDNNAAWVRLRQPFMKWQLRTFASKIASVTTVSTTIARRYADEFGIAAGTVTNASPYRNLVPRQVSAPIRLVHSGASRANRRIEVMMRAVAASKNDVLFDLYLTGMGTPYHDQLLQLADELGERIQVLPPVPHESLVDKLNEYDIGIHLLPPTNSNNMLALPNKFFDYVQARLGLIIGPTASMADLLHEYSLGVVASDFTTESLTAAIDDLDVASVQAYKSRSDAAAHELSAEAQNGVWSEAIARLDRS
ncbi:glycosyltransferase family 4 protein [Leucobacter alluvii]|uniref:Glycosyltransferase family 4 protein n=1 Tax=Leucobacter alluvii TaxID=340321 RepID=A0ABP5N159_9MICO